MIAMSIFIVFTGILINSYTSIVRSQHEANEYRILYTEARSVFDTLTESLRNETVDFCYLEDGSYENASDLYLVSKDGLSKTHVDYVVDDFLVRMGKATVQDPAEKTGNFQYVDLNSEEVRVTQFNTYVTPSFDPYDQENFEYANTRFHPKVTVYAMFEKDGKGSEPLSMDFQTTISSRTYNSLTDCNFLP